MHRLKIHIALTGWLLAFSAAAQSRFSQDVRGYDVESLAWAAAMSLFGGALRTIFTLASDSAVVGSIGREVLKDAIIAIIAGVVAYIALEAIRAASWFPLPGELRFALIVFAGWSRLRFFGLLDTFGSRMSNAAIDRMVGIVSGGTAAPAIVPDEKPKPFQEKE